MDGRSLLRGASRDGPSPTRHRRGRRTPARAASACGKKESVPAAHFGIACRTALCQRASRAIARLGSSAPSLDRQFAGCGESGS
jgi:hypothetical protein